MTDWLQVLIAGVLVFITWRYVVFTKKIMEASVAQAEASNRTARVVVHQFKIQQVQQLLPLRLAIVKAQERIEAWRRAYDRGEPEGINTRLYSTDLDNALAIARTTSSAITLNLESAIQHLRDADASFDQVDFRLLGWESSFEEPITSGLRSIDEADDHLQIAKSWIEPLLKPVEGVAYPTDSRVEELTKDLWS